MSAQMDGDVARDSVADAAIAAGNIHSDVPQTVEFIVLGGDGFADCSNAAIAAKKVRKVKKKGRLQSEKLSKGDKKQLRVMVADYLDRGTFEEILWTQQKEQRIEELRERARARVRRAEERIRASIPDDGVYDTSEWTLKLTSRFLRGIQGDCAGAGGSLFRLTDPTFCYGDPREAQGSRAQAQPSMHTINSSPIKTPHSSISSSAISKTENNNNTIRAGSEAVNGTSTLNAYLESFADTDKQPTDGFEHSTPDGADAAELADRVSSLKMAAERVIQMKGNMNGGRRRSVDKINRYRELMRQEMAVSASASAGASITASLPKAKAFALFWRCVFSSHAMMTGSGELSESDSDSDSDNEEAVGAAEGAGATVDGVKATAELACKFHDDDDDDIDSAIGGDSEVVDPVRGDVLEMLKEFATGGGDRTRSDSLSLPTYEQEEAAEAAARRAEMQRWVAEDERRERGRRRVAGLGYDVHDDETDETDSRRYLEGFFELSIDSQLTTDPTVMDDKGASATSPTRRFVNTADKTFFYKGYHRDRLPLKRIDINKKLTEALDCEDDDSIDDEFSADYEWASSRTLSLFNGRSIQIPSVSPEPYSVSNRARRDIIGEAMTAKAKRQRIVMTITAYELELEALTGVDVCREDVGAYYYAYRPGHFNTQPASDGLIWQGAGVVGEGGTGTGVAGAAYLSGRYSYDDKRQNHRTTVAPVRRLARYPIRSRGQNFEEVVFDPQDLSLNVFKTRDGAVRSHLIVGLQSVFATKSKFPEMVTLRSTEPGSGYVGTIRGKYWVSLLGDIQLGVMSSVRARRRVRRRGGSGDDDGIIAGRDGTFITGGGGNGKISTADPRSGLTVTPRPIPSSIPAEIDPSPNPRHPTGEFTAEYYASQRLKPGIIIEDSIYDGSVVGSLQPGLTAIGDAFSDFDIDLFESSADSTAPLGLATYTMSAPPRGPVAVEDREVFIPPYAATSDDMEPLDDREYDDSPEGHMRRRRRREMRLRREIVSNIVKFPSIVLPFEQIRQPGRPYLSQLPLGKESVSAHSSSSIDSAAMSLPPYDNWSSMHIDPTTIADVASTRLPAPFLEKAERSPASLMDLSATLTAADQSIAVDHRHLMEMSSVRSLQSSDTAPSVPIPMVVPVKPIRMMSDSAGRSHASSHRRIVYPKGDLYLFESTYNSDMRLAAAAGGSSLLSGDFVVRGSQPSFSTTLIASPVAVKVPGRRPVVSRKTKLMAEEKVKKSLLFPKNYLHAVETPSSEYVDTVAM